MGNIFSLDAMRDSVEREFAPCRVELAEGKVLTLRNLLRLPKKHRDEVYALLDQLSELQKSAEDSEESRLVSTEKSAQIALQILPMVADSEKLGRILVEEIEDDLALTLRVFSTWMEGSQAGESEGSPSS